MSLPPPPPPGAPPPGYQPYGQPYGQPPAVHPSGTTVLVLGILSLAICGFLGPFAWAMGTRALREIDAQPGVVFSNRGNVVAGRICGIISSCLLILGIGFFIVLIAAGGFRSNN